jgi:hypothetical protein
MHWSAMHRMETGAKHDAAYGRKRSRAARRRRRTTLAVLALAALSIFGRLCTAAFATRALAKATAAGEQCWPLAGRHASAVVLVPTGRVLWWPRYDKDEAPGDVIRAHERSTLCPDRVTRIRPKRVVVRHGTFGRASVTLSDKHAVCVTHYADYFNGGRKC